MAALSQLVAGAFVVARVDGGVFDRGRGQSVELLLVVIVDVAIECEESEWNKR